MSTLAPVLLVLCAAFLLWWAPRAILVPCLDLERMYISALRELLLCRSIDPAEIPEAAYAEISRASFREAQRRADIFETKSNSPNGWRRQLLALVEAEADLIHDLLKRGSDEHRASATAATLSKFGVRLDNRKIFDSIAFLVACERGTLFAELAGRALARDASTSIEIAD